MQKTAKGCRIAWWRQRWLAKTLLVMRITIVLMTVALLEVHAKGVSQSVSLTGKDMPVTKVFTVIKEQTGYTVFGNLSLLDNAKPVTIRAKDMPLEEFLKAAMNEQPFDYELSDKMIILSKKMTAPSVFGEEANNPPVSGIIRDADGNPLQGVNVVVKGTKRGMTTDVQGRFSIDAKENDVLVISSIGYNAREVRITSVNVPHIVALDKSVSELDEVQYIAYGTQTRRFSVGNVTTVKGEDIAKQPVNNPLLALQGRVPGLNITQETGMNGGAVKMRVQGENSILNGNNPLIVVDGVPYPSQLPYVNASRFIIGNNGNGSPLGFLSINDIESIDVLKDADATSIYGSRAANGAILITTKKGKAGKMKLNISLQQGWSEVANKMEMMNTRQYLDMRYEGLKNASLTPVSKPTSSLSDIYAPDLKIWDTTRYTDWQKELIGGTAKYVNYNVSVSGGTQTSNYMIGVTHTRNTDVYPGEHEMKGGALHFNLNTASLNQKFKIQITGTYTLTDNSLPGGDLTADAIRLVPVAPPLLSADTLNWAPDSRGRDTWDHPLEQTFFRRYSNDTRVLYTSGRLSYNVIRGLELQCQLGYNSIQAKSNYALPLASIRPAARMDVPRRAEFNNTVLYNLIAEPQLSYNGNFGKARLIVLSGISFQKNSTSSTDINASGYTSDLLLNGTLGAPLVSTSISESIYRYNALFGRLGFTWDEKYIVSINGRRDGSSRFGFSNKFHDFGSVGLAWIFTEESWINRINRFFSFGKFRLSYGTTGSDQIGDYRYLSSNIPVPSGMQYQGSAAMAVNMLHNPYLKWEETYKWQSGIDLGFWKDRMLLSVTYSKNRSSNQLIDLQLPSVTGFRSVSGNFPATVQNISWELILSTVNVKTKNFKWNSSINITIPRNKLVAFPNLEQSSYSMLVVGEPLDVRRVTLFKGLDPLTGLYVGTDFTGNPSTGDIIASNFISFAPKFYGGYQNTISFKNVHIDFLFQYVRQWGNRQFEYSNGEWGPGFAERGRGNQPVAVLDRWQKPGDVALHAPFSASPDYINSLTGDPYILSRSDAYYTLDASYLRLKNLSLSWDFPYALLKRIKLQQCRLYTHAQNLLTITRYNGLDPETQNVMNLPPLRTWAIGLQIGL